jgi:class 3 adenylate cyclase
VAWAPLRAPAADLKDLARLARTDWSSLRRLLAGRNFPEGPASLQRAWGAAMKNTVSPETGARQMETYAGIDLDALLPAVTTPVLVLTRAQPWARQNTMHVTGLLPNSQLRFVPGDAVTPFPEHGPVVEAVFEFMGLSGPTTANAAMPRGTAVIVFTDVADSTALTERMGDAAFRAASRTLDAAVRAAIRDCGGSPVEGKVLGDGVMGVFTSAAQAIDAARRCVVLSGESELRLHIGLHAGDVIREEDNVYGGAVNIASRICGLCEPGEILVSGTIRDLARTSAGATFEDRGEHLLKGIDDPVRVFAVRAE